MMHTRRSTPDFCRRYSFHLRFFQQSSSITLFNSNPKQADLINIQECLTRRVLISMCLDFVPSLSMYNFLDYFIGLILEIIFESVIHMNGYHWRLNECLNSKVLSVSKTTILIV